MSVEFFDLSDGELAALIRQSCPGAPVKVTFGVNGGQLKWDTEQLMPCAVANLCILRGVEFDQDSVEPCRAGIHQCRCRPFRQLKPVAAGGE